MKSLSFFFFNGKLFEVQLQIREKEMIRSNFVKFVKMLNWRRGGQIRRKIFTGSALRVYASVTKFA